MPAKISKKKYDTVSKIQRNSTIIFKVSDEEKRIIVRAADRLGISVGAYIRLSLLNNKKIFERKENE